MGFLEDLAKGAEDLGNAAASAASTLGDFVEGAVETVTKTTENVVNDVADTVQDGINAATGWLAANAGPIVGGVANVVGGVVVGLIEGVQDIVVDVVHIVDDVGGIVGSLLRLDIPRVIEELLNLAIDVADLALDVVRFVLGGYIVAAIIDNFEREDLRVFVRDLITRELADRPDLQAILQRLNLSGGNWGLTFNADSHVMMLDTGTNGVAETVRAMHNDSDLDFDLYALAGLLSFDSFSFMRARTQVRVVELGGRQSLLPANRFRITRFLEGEDIRLQILALTPIALNDTLRVARAKFARMGVRIVWNDDFGIPTFGRMTTHEITASTEFRLNIFPSSRQAAYFQESGLKDPATQECPAVALAAFRYVLNAERKEIFGQVCGRSIVEGPAARRCQTPGRTDDCCMTVDRQDGDQRQGSGVIYRDIFPPYFSRYILAHELGHYFGLCHFNHDGVQNIMFSTAGGSRVFDWGLVGRYYLYSEPQFSHDDAKNVWRFIVDQMRECL